MGNERRVVEKKIIIAREYSSVNERQRERGLDDFAWRKRDVQREGEEDFVCLCSGTKKLFAGATDKKILDQALNSLPRRFHYSYATKKFWMILPESGERTRLRVGDS